MELGYKPPVSPWPFLTTKQVSWFCVPKLKVGTQGDSALMTSDRGSEGGAELDLNTPVTPKSPGLNPNASVFLSKTPPSNPDNGQWEEDSAHSTESAENYQLNGDVGKGEAVYPPTPESPPLVASEYSTVQESAPPPPPPPPLNFTPDSNGNIQTEENVPMDGSIPEENLRQMLRTQLEYYFSRENLSHDSYLMSQMDSDQYVPIFTVANFRQVKRLTTNMELIVSVLRELANVQVDEKGERVRPNHNRCIVILREVPESTPVETVKELFSGENCPKFVSCEFAHNDSWYVTFESDETAQRAYQYLREDVKTFLGKPIMARIKAKTLIRTTMYRNGIKPQGFEQTASYPMQQQQGATTPGQQPRYNYSSVPTIQYVNGNQGFQFPPYNTIMTTAWAPPLLDPGMVLAMNGYQAVKIQNSGRQHYPTRSRNPKQSRHNSDRSLESRMNHERSYGGVSSGSSSGGSHRTSPRSLDGTQGPAMGPGPMYHPRRESAPNQPPLHIHQPPIPAHLDSSVPTVMPAPHQSPASDGGHKDQSLLSQRAPRSYRSGRRRKEEEGTVGARNSRTNSSQLSTKDARFIEPQFELEPTSFPPLPGSSNNSATGDIFESKLSDVVKGTARPGPKEVVAKTTTQQTSASPQPTKEPALISTMATTTASSTTSINNNNNNTPVAMVTATTTTTVSSPAATTTSNSGMSSMATLASSLPTPPPSPEKMERTTEQKYEPRFEKSQRSGPSHPQPSQHTAHSAANQRTSAVSSDHKGAESDHSTSKATPPNLKPVFLPEERQPVKLSYAQMVQRRSESENGTGERPKSEESNNGASSEPSSPGGKDQSQHKPHTLKEQSQTARQAPVNSRLPGRDSMRKDSDPKDQRQFVSRRAKENRERRSAAGRRSPNK